MILGTFLRSGSKGVPGWSQGPSQGPSRVKFAPKWVSKWLQNHQKSYLQAFWKRFSKTRALSMFPNSSGPFFSLFLFMQREILCHIYPSKVPTLIHLARGKNLRWMPPRCFQDASRCLHDATRMSPHDSQMLSTRPSLLGSSLQPRFVNKHCLGSSAWVICQICVRQVSIWIAGGRQLSLLRIILRTGKLELNHNVLY